MKKGNVVLSILVVLLLAVGSIAIAQASQQGTKAATGTIRVYHNGWIDFNHNGVMDPYENPQLPVEVRVDNLLSQMTLQEKIWQMVQWCDWRSLADGNSFDFKKAKKLIGDHGIGGLYISHGFSSNNNTPEQWAKFTNAVQKYAIEHTRLGVPVLTYTDDTHGNSEMYGGMILPQEIGMASTFDPDLIEKGAAVTAQELRACGGLHNSAPVLGVARDPRWGRTEEEFGEDPYLVSVMGVATVRGFQGKSLNTDHTVAAQIKHFVAHSAPQGGLNDAPANISQRQLNEIFLPPFKAAIEAGALIVMASYSEINGIPNTSDKELLTNLLRKKWGFRGFTISDSNAIPRLATFHHVASTTREAIREAVNAGIDMEMGSNLFPVFLPELVKNRQISITTIDNAVRDILRVKFLLGLFDKAPYVDPKHAEAVVGTPSHRKIALQMALESLILLKNENHLLPLSKNVHSIAVIGPNANNIENQVGNYTALPQPEGNIVTVLQGIKDEVPKARVIYAPGCEITGASTAGFEDAIKAAKSANVAVVVVGESTNIASEGADRASLDLPGVQLELIKAIYQTGTPTIVVLINGRPLSIDWTAQHIPAIIEAWQPGMEGGEAVAKVLFGDYNPGGKLPITFPRSVGQLPLYYNHKPSVREGSAGRGQGGYVSISGKPLFPFGYGLSYTKFKFSNLNVTPKVIAPDGKVVISVDVQNIGKVEGSEVVQLYIRDPVAPVTRPVKELKGFRRITLKPGEIKKVIFVLSADKLAFYDRDMKLSVHPGVYKVMIGDSSSDIIWYDNFEILEKSR